METNSALEKCRTYVVGQVEGHGRDGFVVHSRKPGPAVTVARETGCGADEITERLAAILQGTHPGLTSPWTVFNRQLVEKVLEEHDLPKSLARLMPEDRRTYLQDVTEELLGLRPPSWKLVPKMAETVLHLAEMGHVILLGRGASLITARLPNVFHVHLVAPLAVRIQRVQETRHLSAEEAAEFIEREDGGRARYVKAYFHRSVDDETQYHLVVNTGFMSCEDAAQLIASGARRLFEMPPVAF